MARRVPGWPSETLIPIWMRLLVSLYSGIDDELLMRLFLLALVLWIAGKIRRSLEPNGAVFWIANAIVALVFAAAYLPAAAAFIPLTKLVIASLLIANGIGGLVFGYLCRRDGLEAAMLAHFTANVVLHIAGPLLQGS